MANELEPYIPRAPGPLATTGDVRTELAKVYRDVRTRKIPSGEGTKLAYILMAIARIIEGAEMERRIEELEKQLTSKGGLVVYAQFENENQELAAIPS